MPTGFDPKLAARLSKLGPVAVPRPAAKIPAKVYIYVMDWKLFGSGGQTVNE